MPFPWMGVMGAASLGLGGYGMWGQRRAQKEAERERQRFMRPGTEAMETLMRMMKEGPGEYEQSDWYKAQAKGVDAQLRKKGVSSSGLASRHMMELGGMDQQRFMNQWYDKMRPYYEIAQSRGLGAAGMSGKQQSHINQMTMASSALSNAGYFWGQGQQPGYDPNYYRDIGAYGYGNPQYNPRS